MHQKQALRFISLPVAAVLGVAIVVACSSESPTGPQKFNPSAPAFAYSFQDNEAVGAPCPNGSTPITVLAGDARDVNGDLLICRKGGAGGKKKGGPKK